MIEFTLPTLKAKRYRSILLLSDFIRHRQFELINNVNKLSFDFMGDSTKFYTPSQFTTYHDVNDALAWMKNADIHFKSDTFVYPLAALKFPTDYDQGYDGEISHVIMGLAVLAKIKNPTKRITSSDIVYEAMRLKAIPIQKRNITISQEKLLELEIKVYESTIFVVKNPIFLGVLNTDMLKACNYVNTLNVQNNISRLNSMTKYRIKLVIGNNRSTIRHDIKLFEHTNGVLREILLESSASAKPTNKKT